MIYRIQFEDADDGGVGAYLPDMPGVAVVGENRAEAIMMLDDAVRWHVEALLTDGTPLPDPVEEATQPGEWTLILDRTYLPRINAALSSIVTSGTSNSAPFWESNRLKLRVVERVAVLA